MVLNRRVISIGNLFLGFLLLAPVPLMGQSGQASQRSFSGRKFQNAAPTQPRRSLSTVSFDEPRGAIEEIPRPLGSRGNGVDRRNGGAPPMRFSAPAPQVLQEQSSGPSRQAPDSSTMVPDSSTMVDEPGVELAPGEEILSLTDGSACSCGHAGVCDRCCGDFCLDGLRLFAPERFEFFGGAHAFSGPINYTGNTPSQALGGSFGVQEGFQWTGGMPWIFCGAFTGQIGLRATQNQWDGSPIFADRRDQLFWSAGMFRRVDYGVQGGVSFDTLREDWYIQTQLSQVRGEISYVGSLGNDFGFRFTQHMNSRMEREFNGTTTAVTFSSLQAMDTYRFFYRFRPNHSRTQVNLAAGWTESRRGLLEAGVATPLYQCIGMRVGGTYLLPSQDLVAPYRGEGWSLQLELVYTPRRLFGCGPKYERPLLPVADNSSFMIDRR